MKINKNPKGAGRPPKYKNDKVVKKTFCLPKSRLEHVTKVINRYLNRYK